MYLEVTPEIKVEFMNMDFIAKRDPEKDLIDVSKGIAWSGSISGTPITVYTYDEYPTTSETATDANQAGILPIKVGFMLAPDDWSID